MSLTSNLYFCRT